ncbi:motility associated factor glycosyltransferase family protein [Alteromonas mediterranea]|uniref:motility associated factor glycosyltransferase family protein n=1 Tax=Alteromonas mediterranea TaxID=314275 RepID=UPI00113171EF|nr:6-hydroxymethylpterin diphosphokinase MptE-like protein [Alteromonas mediterranea]QDG37693.1 motility associated factor glycosyltransferase family protein [Alteromonas mediterranea]
MLKNIRLHIDKDEEKQTHVEKLTAAYIESQYKANLLAFRTYIPSLVEQINTIRNDNISIFCNKQGQFNIVDYGVGRTLYGLDPAGEIHQQYSNLANRAICVALNSQGNAHYSHTKSNEDSPGTLSDALSISGYECREKLPQHIETFVVLGIGLGLHIIELVKNHSIENLVVYEPELQYFKCSIFCNKWDEILGIASDKGVRLFFQLGKDGRNIVNDIEELNEHFSLSQFYLYKHYNIPVFDSIEKACVQGDWTRLKREGLNFNLSQTPVDYVPRWTQSINLDSYQEPSEAAQLRRKQNLAAFKKYFPAIYKTFKNYKAEVWVPVEGDNGEINVLKKSNLVSWYGLSPRQECNLNFENFSEQPNKDGLILGYKGKKLKKYLHYQFVNRTEKLLEQVEQEEGTLPETLKSLILFGVGVGYQIETMLVKHNVEKLFICEPNTDFFHASLYAINWDEILADIDQNEGRLYINIGDDGTNLFKDLLNQFYSIGPYILANTYFYQSYYNAVLVSAIANLREQLQVVIAMGEYFDHARFGISHTTTMLDRHTPFLRKSPSQYLSFEDKDVPVFIVGNGPSLDDAIDAIKEWREHAIVVSCGTALSALHKHGITPDFHAEIEQNRSTFDWCCRVDDFAYLKQISLISVNGIHPDTCDLFKDLFIAFKDGESSTVSALEILGRENYEELRFAFPTVSNLAVNLFSKMGMQQLYLFGVDLGFYSKDKHHSKSSSYYDNGKEVYDYEAANNTSIVVPGNFRKTVFTKYEFKMSKTIIEQSLVSNSLSCFNCSDGAKVVGASPLRPDMVLITTTSEQCRNALVSIKENAFTVFDKSTRYSDLFYARFGLAELKNELSVFIEKVRKPFVSVSSVETLIQTQKEMVLESYQRKKSLLFYLLYGTVNYANALLSKLSSTTSDLEVLEKAREEWWKTLNTIAEYYFSDPVALDVTSSCIARRELIFVEKWMHENNVDISIKTSFDRVFIENIVYRFIAPRVPDESRKSRSYSIILEDNINDALVLQNQSDVDSWQLIFSNVALDEKSLGYFDAVKAMTSFYVWYRPLTFSEEEFLLGHVPLVDLTRQHFLLTLLCSVEDVFLFLPKYEFTNSSIKQKTQYLEPLIASLSWVTHFVEYSRYIAVPRKNVPIENIVCDKVGNRGKLHRDKISLEVLLLDDITERKVEQLLASIKNNSFLGSNTMSDHVSP